MNRQCLLLLVSLALIAPSRAPAASDDRKPPLYTAFDVDEKPELKRDCVRAYAAQYRVLEPTPSGAFKPGGKKGTQVSTYRWRDPRSMRDFAIPGRISYAWIVTPAGLVTDVRILHSTDETVSRYILRNIVYERYFAAKLNGTPVASLHLEEWTFGGEEGSRESPDGLGVYHSRDR